MSIPSFLTPEQRAQFQAEADERRENWLRDVKTLLGEIKDWIKGMPGYDLQETETEITEEALAGTYTAPVLEINTPHGTIVVEPIARAVLGADGRVDLYAWPSLARVMLLRKAQKGWKVRTDSGIDWPEPWGKETFLNLMRGLLDAS